MVEERRALVTWYEEERESILRSSICNRYENRTVPERLAELERQFIETLDMMGVNGLEK